ncbi:MAG TPA: SUMF1/EgtB/PvdO family nonheme iron enzyme [Lysobacter sp.]|nr:SUMF1/EgtB/PvdO family nonheme iron enzyme [Lysobacter sp.]
MRADRIAVIALLVAAAAAGCGRDRSDQAARSAEAEAERAPRVTVSGDQAIWPVPAWRAPAVEVTDGNRRERIAQARRALRDGRLFEDADAALPILLALQQHRPGDAAVDALLERALATLVEQGTAALDAAGDSPEAAHRAFEIAAVARVVAPDDPAVIRMLARVDRAEDVERALREGERALLEGRIGDERGAVASFQRALRLRRGDIRAEQGLAAAESALIRNAERAAAEGDFDVAGGWLEQAAQVRPGMSTVADARHRIALQRAARIGRLRDLGLQALAQEGRVDQARRYLEQILRIAPAADSAAIELRERIELATHYGLFRPGQLFTDAMSGGGRGPTLVVIPHGAFRMGAAPGDPGGSDAERPTRTIRFERGLAMARGEITVGEFRRFVEATGHRPRSTRRGFTTAYDERSGNFVRRGGVDWRHDYAGRPAPDDHPVIHVSAKDASAYAEWLSLQTGERYRLPSEAEYEYALRAGSTSPWPWGRGTPPARYGNLTGALDASPSGRRWTNAFRGYRDGAWGPARVGSYRPNAFGVHDLAGNVSEWVADCWHRNYRRAPRGGAAWFNPGCRTRVVRGGSWASAPAEVRSAWRQGLDADTTSPRIGFRVVRDL